MFFFFNDTATTEIYTLSLHDALPISRVGGLPAPRRRRRTGLGPPRRASDGTAAAGRAACTRRARRDRGSEPAAHGLRRSEEHTSELQSPCNLVCRLLLEKKKNPIRIG